MNANKLMDAIGGIDEKYISQYADEKPRKIRRFKRLPIPLAACLAILLCASVCLVSWENNNSKPNRGSSYLMIYFDFEESLQNCSDVVTAKYVGYNEDLDMHVFDVTETLYGSASGQILLCLERGYCTLKDYEDDNFTYTMGDIKYEVGEEYLLPLVEASSFAVYRKFKNYGLARDIFINLNDLTASTMYGRPISEHAKGIVFDENLTVAALTDYAKNVASDTLLIYDETAEYIHSNDMKDIVSGSPIIVKVKVGELLSTLDEVHVYCDYYNCTVTESIKGDLEVGGEYKVQFFGGTVKEGKEYIVAVKKRCMRDDPSVVSLLYFTSKNSLFSVKDHDKIVEIVNSAE